ncbi:hypothetical protein [Streptomyces sp. AA1529]|uniref:hypothetical protein n=1 Tax=Streptomyces sp. AA1529 TaxID=1203257 RepID=UPI00037305EC|nr:hypothetical protein [Streptomyces sp. AA1529]
MSEPQPLTGTRAVRDALGPGAGKVLATHRASGGAVGALAAAVEDAAGEADRLHADLCDQVDDLLHEPPELAEADSSTLHLLQHAGTHLAVLAARCDQQWADLDTLLSYLRHATSQPNDPR